MLQLARFVSPELRQTLRRRSATMVGGVLIGLVALGFASLSDEAQKLLALFSPRIGPAMLLITPAGFALLVYLTQRLAPEARGSGIPQVIAAARLPHPERSALISLKTALAKILLTLGGLLLGASSGREGPTVQISAALMTAVHRLLRVPLSSAVVIAGGAAGVSGAFNTPLAGVVFAVEELAAAYEQRLTLLVMAAVVISGLVSLGIAGNYLYFGSLHDTLGLMAGLIAVPIIGVVGGVSGGLFSRVVLLAGQGMAPAFARIRRHPLWFAAACGAVVAIVGLISGGLTTGTGYAPAKVLIEGGANPAWYAPAKLLTTLATAVSGVPGGVFAPSLSVGAGIGGLVAPLFGGVPSGTVALLMMTAYFVGVVRAPLTSTIIVMEMTDSHALLLALIACAIIAEGAAGLVCKERLYHGLARGFSSGARPPPSSDPATGKPPAE